MSAYRQQINPLLFRAYLKFAVCLNCIHMKIGFWVFILNAAGNLLHRLHSADFIINVHYGYQNRIFPYRLLKLRQGNAAKGINWKIGNFKALFLQPGHCIIYGYTVAYQTLEGQIGGILTADLKRAENEDDPAETGGKETQDMQIGRAHV